MIILSIDHGTKHIGIAICDELEIAARPLALLDHHSKEHDAAEIAALARKHKAEKILLGVSYSEEGDPNDAGRLAINFGRVLTTHVSVPIEIWDESLTTRDAIALKVQQGIRRKRRAGHHDATAAALLLQDYIDNHHDNMMASHT